MAAGSRERSSSGRAARPKGGGAWSRSCAMAYWRRRSRNFVISASGRVPMQEALIEIRNGVRLDLAGGPPLPDLTTGLGRLRRLAKHMPLPADEPGGMDDLAEE